MFNTHLILACLKHKSSMPLNSNNKNVAWHKKDKLKNKIFLYIP